MISIDTLKKGHWPIFLISFISALANLFLPMVLVRVLNPEDIGIYKLFFLYAQSIIYISLSGGPLYSVYYWVGKKENSQIYLGQAWILNLLLSCSFALLGLIFLGPISHFISVPEKYTFLIIIAAITSAPGGFYGEYLIAKGNNIKGSIFNSCFEIFKVIIIVIVVYLTKDIHIAFWAFTILFILKFIIAQFHLIKEGIFSLEIKKEYMKEVIKYCTPISTSGALGFVVEKIDMIVLSSRLDPINFALYSMGSLVIPPLLLLEMSVQKVLIPNLSKAFHHHKKNEMVTLYKKAQSDIAFIIIPAVFGLIIFNRPIIEMLFTKSYMESAKYLQIYAFTYLTFIIPHDSIPRASGNTNWILKIYLLITPLSIISVYLAATHFGAQAALAASILFMYFPKIPGLMYSSKITEHNVLDLIAWRPLFSYTAANLVLLILVVLIKPIFSDEITWFIVLAPLYAIFYLGFFAYKKELKYV